MTPKNILLIEDSNDNNQSCCKELEEEGFTISVKNSVEDALKIKNKPDIIILNLKLTSDVNKNLIEKLKEQKTPVILCSEWGKDKVSFLLWASEVKVVKAGDRNELNWAIKETLE